MPDEDILEVGSVSVVEIDSYAGDDTMVVPTVGGEERPIDPDTGRILLGDIDGTVAAPGPDEAIAAGAAAAGAAAVVEPDVAPTPGAGVRAGPPGRCVGAAGG